MRILKPTWIEHNGFPIFTVDIHPDGTRFATGGGDNRVKIWSIAPVALLEAEDDPSVPRLLKAIDAHYAPVNSVKWSRDGRYLASGSDDKTVQIWGLSSFGAGVSFGGGNTEKTIENWINVATLRGHTADISEVAWSFDGKMLATCSFDKSIIIWDCTSTSFKMIKQLSEHKGIVKGLAWDPIGRYLATQSDDKSVIIWRCSDWQVETTITEPFQQENTSFFLRPCWSPDGQTLCAPHGVNNHSQTAVIIQRTSWEVGCAFVGHKKPISIARYSPVIFTMGKKHTPYCCIVLAGLDNTITMWSSATPRPVMVTRTLFEQSIQDISWAPDGHSMICCSTDGTVGFIEMTPEEIGGTPMPTAEKELFIKKAYGDAVRIGADGLIIGMSASHALNGGASHLMLAENPDQLAMEDSNNDRPSSSKSNNGHGGSQPPATPIQIHPTQVAMQKQTQTIVGGRRRITPLNLGGSSADQTITRPSPVAIPSHIHLNTDSSKTGSSPFATPTKPINGVSTSNESNGSAGKSTLMSGLEARGMGMGGDVSMTDISPPRPPSTKTTPNKDTPAPSTGKQSSSSTTSTTATTAASPGSEPEQRGERAVAKRRMTEQQQQQSETTSKKVKSKSTNKDKTPAESAPKTTTIAATSTPVLSFAENNSALYLAPATASNHISKQLTVLDSLLSPYGGASSVISSTASSSASTTNVSLDISIVEQELPDNSMEYFSTIRCLADAILWENKINGKVCIATGNAQWCAVATQEAILHIYKNNGASLMPNIVLRNQVAFLECNRSSHLMVITIDRYISVWNITKRKYEISNRELPFLLGNNNSNSNSNGANKDKLTIKHTFLTEEGKPIITLSNGYSYVFTTGIGEWIQITDRLGSLSEFNSSDPTGIGILSKLQQQQQGTRPTSMTSLLALSNQPTSAQPQITTTFLEKQIWLAIVLESPNEYKHWMTTYVRFLANNGNQVRLQDLCNDLLGPSNSPRIDVWEPTILGLNKRDLLKELLPIIASNRNLQRMVGQYKESLSSFTSNNPLDILFS
ncbi:hypothetical protein SAMD00019534_119390 [Acytostelium subglobosum LB1]|uniref:hypothetical protein n=1 Tax=Acytostelium subglobosum LB1 TaxID=1410327 RepID=UPI0006450EEB|nr:hypothetical protein SAMD00019534_119390 [Acytostelium subglobosum LB1]GAM28763.1 hypothetical protein SAMD00019534_119390 [Acytostelium subglobosum LB1]|eukprot:XP_012748318.1 hypothetical protein SAMD00019534_119390 [Acytostelium subglobosum LB1]